MYKCYRLECNEELKELINEYKEVGKKIMEDKKESITKNLREYLREDKLIDFTKLQDDWFPMIDSDVFISHSHKDIDVVNGLAGWITEKFKVNVFVDSYIWNYCDDLLKEIDKEYCRHSNGTSYDYDKRNVSTAHVHMMLSNALNKMIDRTECVIFLESENSLNIKNDIEIGTSSAWIYSELITTSIISRRIPKRLTKENVEIRENFIKFNNSLNGVYRVSLDHLIPLSAYELNCIAMLNLNGEKQYLDRLYAKSTDEVLND